MLHSTVPQRLRWPGHRPASTETGAGSGGGALEPPASEASLCHLSWNETPDSLPLGTERNKALLTGEPLVGHWYDRSKEYAARQLRGEDDVNTGDYAREVQVVFELLPCWKDQLSGKRIRDAVQAIIMRIEQKGAAKRKKEKTRSMGVRKILAMDPHHRPKAGEKKPPFKGARRFLEEAQLSLMMLDEGEVCLQMCKKDTLAAKSEDFLFLE